MDAAPMDERHFEDELRKFLPARPAQAVEHAIARCMEEALFRHPESEFPHMDDLQAEEMLRRTTPSPPGAYLEELLALELAEDPSFEAVLREAHPAALPETTRRAVIAQMELHVVEFRKSGSDRIPSSGGETKKPTGGTVIAWRWMAWGALAAAFAVSFLWFEVATHDRFRAPLSGPVSVASDLGISTPRETPKGEVVGHRPDGLGASTLLNRVALRGGNPSTGPIPRPHSEKTSRDAAGWIMRDPKSDREGGRMGDASSARRPVGGEGTDLSSDLQEPFFARKQASGLGWEPSGSDNLGAISTRTLVASGTRNSGSLDRSNNSPSGATDLLETLAAGRVADIVPAGALGWIQEPASSGGVTMEPERPVYPPVAPSNPGLALNPVGTRGAESSGISRSVAVEGPAGGDGAGGIGELPVAPATALLSPGNPSSKIPTKPTTPTGGETLSALQETGVIAGGAVGASQPAPVSGLTERVLYENTDGAVTFSLLRSGGATIGRISDARGSTLTEGVVRLADDVTEIAQRAKAMREIGAFAPVPKGD